MRNPIRLKNLNLRFLPLYVVGGLILVLAPPDRRALLFALPLVLSGLAIRGWGAGHLVKNHALTLTGPYAHLRHPLYAGTILIATGFALAVGGAWSIVLLAGVWPWFVLHYFPRKERSESERLATLYGERFLRYRAAVPALWPRLRAWDESANEADGVHPGEGGQWRLARYSDNNELGTLLAVALGWILFWLRAGGAV